MIWDKLNVLVLGCCGRVIGDEVGAGFKSSRWLSGVANALGVGGRGGVLSRIDGTDWCLSWWRHRRVEMEFNVKRVIQAGFGILVGQRY